MHQCNTTDHDINIGIIGAGRMGRAIHEAINWNSIVFTTSITDRQDPDKLAQHIAAESEVLILATKPLHIQEVAQQIAPHTDGKIIISILAGIRTQILEACFPNSIIVRTMPTIMASKGKSTTGWWTAHRGNKEHAIIEDILQTFGSETLLPREEELDVFTACIGSGPAFLCKMLEQLEEIMATKHYSQDLRCAIEALWWYMHQVWEELLITSIGDAQQTWNTVRSMFEATAHMWQEGWEPSTLRAQITTEGGTTAAGLEVWEHSQIHHLCQKVLTEIAT